MALFRARHPWGHLALFLELLKMTTPKRRSTPVRNDAAAELALARLGTISRLKLDLKSTADAAIAAAREALRVGIAPLDKERKSLKGKLETFAKGRLALWEAGEDGKPSRRTNRYTHGTLGFRKDPPGISTRGVDEAALLLQLKELGLVQCIREYEAPDFQALQREDDETLGLLGLKRTGGDRFHLDFKVPHTSDPR